MTRGFVPLALGKGKFFSSSMYNKWKVFLRTTCTVGKESCFTFSINKNKVFLFSIITSDSFEDTRMSCRTNLTQTSLHYLRLITYIT